MLGRPEVDEAAEFHWNYIRQVQGDNALAVMAEQLDRINEMLGGLSKEQSLYRYAEGKWSLRESMGHVTDTERIFAGRALWFARGLPDALPGFDENLAVIGAEAERISLADHLEEFRQVRLATLSLFRNLPESAWMRKGTASGNSLTVRATAFLIAGHVEHHLRLFRERYLAR